MAAVQSIGDTDMDTASGNIDWTEHCWQIVAISRVGRRVTQRLIHAYMHRWSCEVATARCSSRATAKHWAPFTSPHLRLFRWASVKAHADAELRQALAPLSLPLVFTSPLIICVPTMPRLKPHQALLALSSAMTHTNRFPWQFLFVFSQSRANFFALVSFMRPLCRECKYVSSKNSWYVCMKDHRSS